MTATLTASACVHDPRVYRDQFEFQRAAAVGRILNVGCDSDGAQLGMRPGAVNLDLHLTSKIRIGWKSPVNVLADARWLPFRGSFDTVVLGEILEHMEGKEAVQCLLQAKAALKPESYALVPAVVITIPHDRRKPEDQGYGEVRYFAPGIPVYHPRYVGRWELLEWVDQAGLAPVLIAEIAYPWGEKGTGMIAAVVEGGQ